MSSARTGQAFVSSEIVLASGDRAWTRAQLDRRARQAAAGLLSLGVEPDDTVALFLRNDLALVELLSATTLIGGYSVPINWHFTAEETGYILRDCKAKALIAHADLLPAVHASVPAGVEVLAVETPPEIRDAYRVDPESCAIPDGIADWTAWVDGFDPWDGAAHAIQAPLIYTSGTTGRPKGVRRARMTPEQEMAMGRNSALVFGCRAGMRSAVTGPLYHGSPASHLRATARYDGANILMPRFDAEGLLALVERERITHMHAVPTMFVRLLNLPDDVKRAYDLSSLEFVIHGAAPCPPDVKRAMIEWWGPVINEYYAGTETGLPTFSTSEEWLARPGTLGRATQGSTVRILDDDGNALPPGGIGEIYMRAAGVPEFTYVGRDDLRREIEHDGLVTLGDVGYLDDDGYLFLCDRKKDMIISGGVNIYPAEIEAALMGLPGVRDCAVFGIPDDEFGESVAAVVQPNGDRDLSTDDVRTHLADALAAYKLPKVVEFRDDLPRDDNGKIYKRLIRDEYWRDAGRRI